MAKSDAGSRKGRKLRKSQQAAAAAEQNMDVEPPKEEKRSRGSGRSGKKSKRSTSSRRSKQVVEEVAFMAEGDAPADAPAPAADAPAKEQEFKTEFINADKEDQDKIAAKAFATTSVNARGRVHEFCDDVEVLAQLMLTDALKNKGGRERCLRSRMALLTRLWTYRDTSDCEDDFPIEEFHKEMRSLATVQRKLKGLDSKISALMLGADDDSDDTDGEGEMQNLQNLKQARQNLRYALGEGSSGFA
jgi:hypothetical protein